MTQAELYLLDLLVRVCAQVGVEVEADHPVGGYLDEARAVVAHFRGQLGMTATGRGLLAAAERQRERGRSPGKVSPKGRGAAGQVA